jgi:hypothetical protein
LALNFGKQLRKRWKHLAVEAVAVVRNLQDLMASRMTLWETKEVTHGDLEEVTHSGLEEATLTAARVGREEVYDSLQAWCLWMEKVVLRA